MLIPSAVIVKPTVVPSSTLIEGFENNPYTGAPLISTWDENSTGTVDWVRSTSNVTQGSFSWRYNDTGGTATQILSNISAGVINLSAFTSISLDVFVQNISSGDFLTFALYDASFNTIQANTTTSATGAFTLTNTFSSNPSFNKSSVFIFIQNNGGVGTKDYYIDNLRAT